MLRILGKCMKHESPKCSGPIDRAFGRERFLATWWRTPCLVRPRRRTAYLPITGSLRP